MQPRVWLEDEDRTRTLSVTVQRAERQYTAYGAIGLSAAETKVTGMERILVGGRWFRESEQRAVLLSERMAEELAVDPVLSQDTDVLIWGLPFRVVGAFLSLRLMENTDLDGEPLSTVTFPSEVSMEMTEVEMEAMESGRKSVRTRVATSTSMPTAC